MLKGKFPLSIFLGLYYLHHETLLRDRIGVKAECIVHHKVYGMRLDMISQDDFESTKKKLASFKGVRGVIVTSSEGLPISSTLPTEKTEKVAALITSLVKKTSQVVEALGEESFNFLILDTQKGSNIMVAPEEEQTLIVLKDSDSKSES